MKNTTQSKIGMKPDVSFIIPAMDEEQTIDMLYNDIRENMKELDKTWEVIFIDDGSSDNTWNEIQQLASLKDTHVRGFRFPSNRGKADALALGYQKANGEIVFTMDADLQDDPKEIKRFIEKLEEGFDIVSGWKRKRHDPWHKVLPSRVFNSAISQISGVNLHDHNCGFKVYRKEVVKWLPMYGDMHRMVPSIAAFHGYKSAEIEVEHHAREFGSSKYGWGRIIIGIMDMATVGFLKNFRNCPMHFTGKIAGGLIALSLFLIVMGITALFFKVDSTVMFVTASFSFFTAIIVATQGLVLEHQVYANMKKGRDIRTSESMNDPEETHSEFEEINNNDNETLVAV